MHRPLDVSQSRGERCFLLRLSGKSPIKQEHLGELGYKPLMNPQDIAGIGDRSESHLVQPGAWVPGQAKCSDRGGHSKGLPFDSEERVMEVNRISW